MSYAMDLSLPVAEAAASERAAFIRRTYGHLALALAAFAGLETILLSYFPVEQFLARLAGTGGMLLFFLLFIGVSYLANRWAHSETSRAVQYLGLGAFVAVEAVVFLPILFIADRFYPGVIQSAGVMTLAVFAGLSMAVLFTRSDFSFMGTFLCMASWVALGVILVSWFIGGLGIWFSIAMIALACGYILYDTSNVLHHYRTDQHVAAALALFSSVALLFYYVLRLFMQSRD